MRRMRKEGPFQADPRDSGKPCKPLWPTRNLLGGEIGVNPPHVTAMRQLVLHGSGMTSAADLISHFWVDREDTNVSQGFSRRRRELA
eukprot:scaffold1315_cov359-Pinguiococcus_pyrenoidosus.AAC.2